MAKQKTFEMKIKGQQTMSGGFSMEMEMPEPVGGKMTIRFSFDNLVVTGDTKVTAVYEEKEIS